MRLNVKLAAVLIAVILATSPGALAVGTVTQTPTNEAAPVSAAALYRLYRDKTWLWQNGAGFFAKDGRFSAWSGSGDEATYAEGRWWVNFLGGLCINAAWRSKDWVKVNLTCFSHSKDGNLLYQGENRRVHGLSLDPFLASRTMSTKSSGKEILWKWSF